MGSGRNGEHTPFRDSSQAKAARVQKTNMETIGYKERIKKLTSEHYTSGSSGEILPLGFIFTPKTRKTE